MGCNDLFFVTELADGVPDRVGKGLLAYGARLGKKLDAHWRALVFHSLLDDAQQVFEDFRVPEVTILKDAENYINTPQVLGNALARCFAQKKGGIIVFAHNDLGCTLAPLLAASLDAALITEVNAVSPGDRGVHLSRRMMGNRIDETRIWPQRGFLVITVPVNNLSPVSLPTDPKTALRINEYVSSIRTDSSDPPQTGSVILERIPSDPQTVDLMDAEVIFCAGRGCNQSTFEQLKELCRLLGTSLGVTRPVYDRGWAGFDRMIGQTGNRVKPRLYISFGVSGSMHHVGGIQDAGYIVAIDNDARAPIFVNADQGFVVDAEKLLPLLLEKVRTALGEAS